MHLHLHCPKCDGEFAFDAVTVLSTDSPELASLFRGELNRCSCPHCGNPLNVPVRLTYHELEEPYLLVLEPRRPATPQAVQALVQQTDEAVSAAAQSQGVVRPIARLVFEMPDFLEKISLRRRRLDDRVVEYAKYQLFNGGMEGEPLSPARHRLHFDFSSQNTEAFPLLLFNRKTGRPIRVVQVPAKEFEQLLAEFRLNPELQRELDRLFPGCRVDVDLLFEKQREGQKSC